MTSEREHAATPTGEWVEIAEPSGRKNIFANLTTGELSRSPPLGVKVKRYSDESNQWWELFDQKTKRFYYYNVFSQTTVWHKPVKGDIIIPLAKLQALKQNTEVPEDAEVLPVAEKEWHGAAEPMRREHRRTASARIPRQTGTAVQAPPRSRRNQSQRVAKAGRSVDPELSNDPVSSSNKPCDHSRIVDQCSPVDGSGGECGLAEEVSQVSDWLRRSFDWKLDSVARNDFQRSCPHDSTDFIQNSKQQSAKPDGKTECAFQSSSGDMFLHHDRIRFPASESRHERLSRMQAENFSVDSGITADVSCTTLLESSWTALGNSSPDDPRSYPGAQSSFDHRSSMHRLSLIEEARSPFDPSESVELAIEPQMTPGSRRRAFPRTNPNFVGASFRKTGASNLVNQGMVGELIPPLNALSSQPNQKPTLLCLSHQAGSTAIKTSQKSDSDDSDLSTSRLRNERSYPRQFDSLLKPSSCSDPATSRSSFSYHKITAEDPWLRFPTSANQIQSNNSASSISSGESKAHISRARQSQSVRLRDNRATTNHLGQPRNGKINESSDVIQRVRRNSEPDYANLQEQAMQHDSGEQNRLNNKDVGDRNERTRRVQAKAEPIYANELLTGRGCLTHEDRFHVPLSQGCRDNSREAFSSSSSSLSTPSPRMRSRATHLTGETRHMSLRRKKWPEKAHALESGRSFIDKSRSMHSALSQQRPLSIADQLGPESDAIVSQVEDTLMQQVTLENFLAENLNEHRKGLLGRAVPISSMLVWTKDPIQKPMIRSDNKLVKKEAPELFRLIQTYMGDRKTRDSVSHIAFELVNKGWGTTELRDEIYVQLCRQMTKNMRDESLVSGWELLGQCLSFFPPSAKFQSYLEGHIYRTLDTRDHTDSCKLHGYARSCLRRLEKICRTGATRKPSLEETERCRKSLLEPTMFGNTLQDVMDLQRERYPDRQLPWIQISLSEALLNSQKMRILEGIFRVPGDVDEVNALKAKCDRWEAPHPRMDPHVIASVLKLWYRELYEPLIPHEFYDGCVKNCEDPGGAIAIVGKLPPLNMLVLTYLIRFLQKFASAEYSKITKMDASNLAMVMAPNCLRCQADNPQVLFDNVRKEMSFIRTLIQNLDTSYIDNIK